VTGLAVLLCILCQFFLVAGQLFLKHAMNAFEAATWRRPKVLWNFAAGVGLLTLWFFLWLGLLGHWELSQLFPFEGLNPALLVLGASLFLKERVPPAAWVGIVLISGGVALVSVG
jgi:undecaprenyl phosphate-alpha-L-ara4N flippase subunit ArnE